MLPIELFEAYKDNLCLEIHLYRNSGVLERASMSVQKPKLHTLGGLLSHISTPSKKTRYEKSCEVLNIPSSRNAKRTRDSYIFPLIDPVIFVYVTLMLKQNYFHDLRYLISVFPDTRIFLGITQQEIFSYAIGSKDPRLLNHLKLGESLTLKKRIRDLQTANFCALEPFLITNILPETWFHTFFAEYRELGEWFDLKELDFVQIVTDNILPTLKATINYPFNTFIEKKHIYLGFELYEQTRNLPEDVKIATLAKMLLNTFTVDT